MQTGSPQANGSNMRQQSSVLYTERQLALVEYDLRCARGQYSSSLLEKQGDIYRNRPIGFQLDNLDRAIVSFRRALTLSGQETSSEARLCAKLARTVYDRMSGHIERRTMKKTMTTTTTTTTTTMAMMTTATTTNTATTGTTGTTGTTNMTDEGIAMIQQTRQDRDLERRRVALLSCVDLVNAAIGMYERHAAWCDDVEQAEFYLGAWVCRGLIYGALYDGMTISHVDEYGKATSSGGLDAALDEGKRVLKRRTYVNECIRSLEHALASGAPRSSKADVLRDQKNAVALAHCPATVDGLERLRVVVCVARAYVNCEDVTGAGVEKALQHLQGVEGLIKTGGKEEEGNGRDENEMERLGCEAKELQTLLKAASRSGPARCVMC